MSSLILVWGEEEFCVHQTVQDIIDSALTENVEYYDFSDFLNVRPDYETPATLYVVKECEDVPHHMLDQDTVLAIGKAGIKKFESNKVTREFYYPKLKSYENDNQVVEWILKEGQRLNIDLSAVANPLFLTCGNRLRKLHSEMKKLLDLCGPGKVVTVQDFKSVCSRSAEITPKEVIDCVNRGDVRSAMSYYDILQEKADETGWIISYFHKQAVTLLQVSHFKKSAISDIPSKLKIHPYVFLKNIEPISKLYSDGCLEESARVLSRLDHLNKTGRYDVKPELEEEIIRLSQETANVLRKR